jgi:hypothetical protein
VYFEKENIDTATMSGEMMTALFASFAQSESESISGNMRWSYQKRMQSGTFIPSSVPYGYRLDGKELKIVPNEATVVCEIFKEYLSGKSKTLIAENLNKNSVPTRSGKPWCYSTVSYILDNERYMGNSMWQKTYMTNSLPTRHLRNYGERTKYYAENTNPAIIDREVFCQTQSLKTQRENNCGNKPTGREYALAKTISCPKCGRVWRRKVTNSVVYWICPKHESNAELCGTMQIPESEFKAAFIRLYYKLKHHSEDIFQPMLSKLQTIENRRMLWSMDVIELNNQISDLQCQNQMLTQLNQQGLIDSDIFIYQSNEIASQMRELKRKKAQAMDNGDDKTMVRTSEIIEALESGSESMDEFDEPMFNELVEKIIVDSNEQIRFRLKNGLELTEQIERTKR